MRTGCSDTGGFSSLQALFLVDRIAKQYTAFLPVTHGLYASSTHAPSHRPRPAAAAAASMRPVGQYAGGVAGAALGALLTKKLLEKRQSAAIIELSNLLVQMGDPTQLTREQVRRRGGGGPGAGSSLGTGVLA